MFLQPTSVTPVIIKVVPPPTPDVSIIDVVAGSLGLTGVITIAALVVGGILGVALIAYKRWQERTNRVAHGEGIRLDLSSH
jgi:hypothetical protein